MLEPSSASAGPADRQIVLVHRGEPATPVRGESFLAELPGAAVSVMRADSPAALASSLADMDFKPRSQVHLVVPGLDAVPLFGPAADMRGAPAMPERFSVTALDLPPAEVPRLMISTRDRFGTAAPKVTSIVTGDAPSKDLAALRPRMLAEHLSIVDRPQMTGGLVRVDWERIAEQHHQGLVPAGGALTRHLSLLTLPLALYEFGPDEGSQTLVVPDRHDIDGQLAALALAQRRSHTDPDDGMGVLLTVSFHSGKSASSKDIDSAVKAWGKQRGQQRRSTRVFAAEEFAAIPSDQDLEATIPPPSVTGELDVTLASVAARAERSPAHVPRPALSRAPHPTRSRPRGARRH